MEDDVELLLRSSLNVDQPFNSSSILNGVSSDEERPFHAVDTTCASSELLQNGIFVETKQGLVCLTLKDALTSGLGGLNLSVEDLQHVAEQLVQQNGTASASICSTGSISEVSEVSEVELSATEDVNPAYECALLDGSHAVATNEYLTAGSPLEPLELEYVTYVSTTATAERAAPALPKAVQVPASIARANSAPASSQKKRGGWPKGRKRKPEAAIRPPKAPATGYVLYLNEKRKLYKDIPFPDVTKLLGNEWSRMGIEEKRVYLEKAEVEKKRYKQELLLYRKSDDYRNYLNKQRLKRFQNNGTEESDMDATDEIDEEDNEELYCRTCDQWFNTLHNKKEHLYGRQHLQSISNEFNKKNSSRRCDIPDSEGASSCSFDESSLDGTSTVTADRDVALSGHRVWDQSSSAQLGLPYMNDAIASFMQIAIEREREAAVLRQRVSSLTDEKAKLEVEVLELKEKEAQAKVMLDAEQVRAAVLETQLFNLLAVPALFVENTETACTGSGQGSAGNESDGLSSQVVLVLSDIDMMSGIGSLPDPLTVS